MVNPQAKAVPDPPIYTPFETSGKISDLWRAWVQKVSDNANRTGASTNGGARAVASLLVGASPWTYQSNYGGDVRLLVSGGTGVSLQYSRDNSNFYNVGVAAGQVTLSQSDFLKITYTTAPTVIAVPA